jgi:hypothetical protein
MENAIVVPALGLGNLLGCVVNFISVVLGLLS